MKIIFALLVLLTTNVWAATHEKQSGSSHSGHLSEEFVNGEKLEVNPKTLTAFTQDLSKAQIAVVRVKGMVCDFCARGIEKIFKRDPNVKKIDVDLSKGKVLIAYAQNAKIDFDNIKEKILSNGLNATDLQIMSI